VFPETQVQGCIVHLLRNSLEFCSWQDRKAVAEDLKGVYKASNPEAAAERLAEFEAGSWGQKYQPIGRLWHRAWEQVIPFFAYPEEVRRVIYTTNAIESLNSQLRKILKSRGHFPTDEAATKLIYLVLHNISRTWTMPARSWKAAMTHFAILFPEAFDEPAN
jgi:transposase-like protein